MLSVRRLANVRYSELKCGAGDLKSLLTYNYVGKRRQKRSRSMTVRAWVLISAGNCAKFMGAKSVPAPSLALVYNNWLFGQSEACREAARL